MNWTGRMMETIMQHAAPRLMAAEVRAEAKCSQGSSPEMVLILRKGLSEPSPEAKGEP